ncbi:hypothetical protein A4S06_05205 [Erysipelotrichaceae bacterium MTC7]|nr:hypothetical protein A4S06_05205 [Erysipelotrichaceae bacterium MTC7]
MEDKITVKEAREKAGYSIREMAELMGWVKTTYVNKENGISKFYVDEAVRFSRIVKVPMSNIIFF